jgi:hypothetical protein
MNEKGAVALAATFPRTIPNLQPRIEVAFANFAPNPAALDYAVVALEEVAQECAVLVAGSTEK